MPFSERRCPDIGQLRGGAARSAASASAMAEEDVDLEWFKHKPFEEDYTVTRLLGEVSPSSCASSSKLGIRSALP